MDNELSILEDSIDVEDISIQEYEKIFDFEKYWSMNLWAISNHKQLFAYVSDEKSVKSYVNENTYTYYMDQDVEKKEGDSKEYVELISSSMKSAMQLMNNQMIVYMSTIVETALNDYFKCIFIKNPNLVIGLDRYFTEKCDLRISYSDFLKYESKEAYIIEVSKRAAKLCNSGKIEKIIKRIFDMFKLKFPEECSEAIKAITLNRNKIVHENTHLDISIAELHSLSDGLEKFLELLAKNVKEMDIMVKDGAGILLEDIWS